MFKYIQRFTIISKKLFRVNNGSIFSRDRIVRKTESYDLLTEVNKVKLKALDSTTYANKFYIETYDLIC